MTRVVAALAAVALVVALPLVAGCGRGEPPLVSPRPTGYHPDRFPDIRLPGGYMLRDDRDHLAVTYAGGALRRFDVGLIAKPDNAKDGASDAMAWFQRVLPQAGWKERPNGSDRERRWRKPTPTGEQEELVATTGRSSSRTTIDLRLEPVR